MTPTLIVEWLGCITGVIGSALLAANTAQSRWGFVWYLASNACWLVFALRCVSLVRATAPQAERRFDHGQRPLLPQRPRKLRQSGVIKTSVNAARATRR
jgi:hypothetical protein